MDEMAMMISGSRLRRVRLRLGESQGVFARHFGIDQATISRWETSGVPRRGVTHLAVERILTDLANKLSRESWEHIPLRRPKD